jgi:hypothetical protein
MGFFFLDFFSAFKLQFLLAASRMVSQNAGVKERVLDYEDDVIIGTTILCYVIR